MNRWFVAGLALLWAASLVAVGWWQNSAGHTAERVEWQSRENKELREANDRIAALNKEARAREAENAQRLADISSDHQKEIQRAKVQRDRDVAAARSGALVLRYQPAAGESAAGGGIRPPGASAGRCDGRAPGELPRAVAADLLELVNDADDVARQLAAAQRVIAEDRRLCGQMRE